MKTNKGNLGQEVAKEIGADNGMTREKLISNFTESADELKMGRLGTDEANRYGISSPEEMINIYRSPCVKPGDLSEMKLIEEEEMKEIRKEIGQKTGKAIKDAFFDKMKAKIKARKERCIFEVVSEEQTNPYYDPERQNNGGGYKHILIRFNFMGTEGVLHDTSCGDFGHRFYVEWNGYSYDFDGIESKTFEVSTFPQDDDTIALSKALGEFFNLWIEDNHSCEEREDNYKPMDDKYILRNIQSDLPNGNTERVLVIRLHLSDMFDNCGWRDFCYEDEIKDMSMAEAWAHTLKRCAEWVGYGLSGAPEEEVAIRVFMRKFAVDVEGWLYAVRTEECYGNTTDYRMSAMTEI